MAKHRLSGTLYLKYRKGGLCALHGVKKLDEKVVAK